MTKTYCENCGEYTRKLPCLAWTPWGTYPAGLLCCSCKASLRTNGQIEPFSAEATSLSGNFSDRWNLLRDADYILTTEGLVANLHYTEAGPKRGAAKPDTQE